MKKYLFPLFLLTVVTPFCLRHAPATTQPENDTYLW